MNVANNIVFISYMRILSSKWIPFTFKANKSIDTVKLLR